MRQSTKRLVSVAIAVVCIIAAVVTFVNFTQKAYQEAKEIRSEQASRENFIETQKDAIEKVSNLIATYQGKAELRGVVTLVLPLEPDVATALAQLNGLAAEHALAPLAFSVTSAGQSAGGRPLGERKDGRSPALTKPVAPVIFRVKLSGGYEDFKRFLGDLETNIRLFDVRDIQMQQSGKQNEDFFTYDIQVATYYQSS